jgi:hypothetical protein
LQKYPSRISQPHPYPMGRKHTLPPRISTTQMIKHTLMMFCCHHTWQGKITMTKDFGRKWNMNWNTLSINNIGLFFLMLMIFSTGRMDSVYWWKSWKLDNLHSWSMQQH